MGGKTRRPRRPKQVREIRQINAKLVLAKDGGISKAETSAMIDRKDDLLNEMWSSCDHQRTIEAKPEDDPRRLGADCAMRICLHCGFDEMLLSKDEFEHLTEKPQRVLSRSEWRVEAGKLIKRLGINI